MAIYGLSAEERFRAVLSDVFVKLGITLAVGTDFHEFKEFVAEARPDHPLGDPFRPDLHEMSPQDCRWIVGRDMNGKIMHLHALRALPMEGQSVAEYFHRNFRGFSPSELDIDYERSRFRACPDAKRMYGRVIYSGEIWVDGAPGKYRGTGLIGFLIRFAMMTAMRELSADYMLGFMARPLSYKGVSLHFGAIHADPLALRWYEKGKVEPLEGTMFYMGEEDMRYIMDLPVADLETLANAAAA